MNIWSLFFDEWWKLDWKVVNRWKLLIFTFWYEFMLVKILVLRWKNNNVFNTFMKCNTIMLITRWFGLTEQNIIGENSTFNDCPKLKMRISNSSWTAVNKADLMGEVQVCTISNWNRWIAEMLTIPCWIVQSLSPNRSALLRPRIYRAQDSHQKLLQIFNFLMMNLSKMLMKDHVRNDVQNM